MQNGRKHPKNYAAVFLQFPSGSTSYIILSTEYKILIPRGNVLKRIMKTQKDRHTHTFLIFVIYRTPYLPAKLTLFRHIFLIYYWIHNFCKDL
jgi:hypothetical protein